MQSVQGAGFCRNLYIPPDSWRELGGFPCYKKPLKQLAITPVLLQAC